jgi:hypothetical protein
VASWVSNSWVFRCFCCKPLPLQICPAYPIIVILVNIVTHPKTYLWGANCSHWGHYPKYPIYPQTVSSNMYY